MINPFRNWIVGSPWENGEGDVAEIGSQAFATCLTAIDTTARDHSTTSVLLYGEPGSGKTHLIRRIRAHLAARKQSPRALFVYIRLSTSPNMVWRHIRRRLAEDLLRPIDSTCNQLRTVLLRRLAMPGSHGTLLDSWKRAVAGDELPNLDAFAVALRVILGKIPAPVLEQLDIFDRLDGEADIPWALRQILRHIAQGRHTDSTSAWLRGDSLPEEQFAKLGMGPEPESASDPEDRARQMVLALARFAGADSPIVFCFDQVEALETNPGDPSGFAALARTVSTLHDESNNLVLISCIQTSYRDVLRRFQSDYARIAEYEGHLPLLDRGQAARLLQSRRPADGGPALWPLEEADLAGVFDQAGLASARKVLSEASQKFDRLAQTPAPHRDTMESEWRRRLDDAARTIEVTDVDEILDHGLKSLVRAKGAPWAVKAGSEEIELVLASPHGEVEISLCNQANMRTLSARLKRLVAYHDERPKARMVLVRDPRLPLSAGAKTVHEHLEELDFYGARLIHPSVEALTALEATRRFLSDASSGDLTVDGKSVKTRATEQWLASHIPPAAEALLREIAAGLS